MSCLTEPNLRAIRLWAIRQAVRREVVMARDGDGQMACTPHVVAAAACTCPTLPWLPHGTGHVLRFAHKTYVFPAATAWSNWCRRDGKAMYSAYPQTIASLTPPAARSRAMPLEGGTTLTRETRASTSSNSLFLRPRRIKGGATKKKRIERGGEEKRGEHLV